MSDPAPTIAYASAEEELPSDRLLRRIVALSAMIYGGAGLLSTALHIALAMKWAATPPNMGWGIGGEMDMVFMAVHALGALAILVGGVLLLLRSQIGILLLRISSICVSKIAGLYETGATSAL